MKKRSGQNWALEDLSGSLFVGAGVGGKWKREPEARPVTHFREKQEEGRHTDTGPAHTHTHVRTRTHTQEKCT